MSVQKYYAWVEPTWQQLPAKMSKVDVTKVFFTCVTNLIQIIFKYELQFVAFTWPNLCLWVAILCPAFVS